MKRLLILPALFIATAAAAQGDLKTQLSKVYAELNGYMKTKNVAGAERLFAKHAHPQFVYLHPSGRKQNGKQMLDEMKQSLTAPGATMIKSISRLEKLKVGSSAAVATTFGDWAMKMTGPDGKPHTFGGTSTTEDTWVRTSGGWKLKQVKVLTEKMTMDGKPFKM